MAEIRPKIVAGIGLFLNQPLYWHFADFFTLRSVDNRVLLNLASTRHQLAKQRPVLLAKCCFLFIYLSLFLIFLQFTRLTVQSIA